MKTPSHSDLRALRRTPIALGCLLALAFTPGPTSGTTNPSGLTITPSVLLSWPGRSAETNVVVAAPSLHGPWVPSLEPVFNRLGQVCVAVPVVGTQQYFQLRPGFQIIDDCSGKPNPWVYSTEPSGGTGVTLTHTNGALRVRASSGGAPVLWYAPTNAPSAADLVSGREPHGDFACSIDVLSWGEMGQSNFYLTARATWEPYGACYAAIDWEGHASTSMFLFVDWEDPNGITVSAPCPVVRGKSYRLVFFGVGDRLTAQVFEIGGASQPIATAQLVSSKVESGIARTPGIHKGPGGTDVTVDNFRFTGVRP